MDRVFIDAKELAQAIGVKLPTIRRWCCYTDIPKVPVGRLVKFRLADVLTWIENGGPAKIHHQSSTTLQHAA